MNKVYFYNILLAIICWNCNNTNNNRQEFRVFGKMKPISNNTVDIQNAQLYRYDKNYNDKSKLSKIPKKECSTILEKYTPIQNINNGKKLFEESKKLWSVKINSTNKNIEQNIQILKSKVEDKKNAIENIRTQAANNREKVYNYMQNCLVHKLQFVTERDSKYKDIIQKYNTMIQTYIKIIRKFDKIIAEYNEMNELCMSIETYHNELCSSFDKETKEVCNTIDTQDLSYYHKKYFHLKKWDELFEERKALLEQISGDFDKLLRALIIS